MLNWPTKLPWWIIAHHNFIPLGSCLQGIPIPHGNTQRRCTTSRINAEWRGTPQPPQAHIWQSKQNNRWNSLRKLVFPVCLFVSGCNSRGTVIRTVQLQPHFSSKDINNSSFPPPPHLTLNKTDNSICHVCMIQQ